ncbi:unnamed protein product [Tuber melanosporum]|uniref:NADH dehydrogenase [ubiquinone] iron-sulfur protein 5 n=1 Tax=Tuber melanosporum (strain Mel28) TaxID=656061 RepID=D5G6X0_TUBMM|nr:uncharacterized protein GSTUM_00002365001 [Tuber melanosporum]CAZ80263.1 unnamed protein product [Tuber melanosporum]
MPYSLGAHADIMFKCFPFWQDLLSCYVVNTGSATSDEGKWKCVPQRDDYYECLHHKKEIRKTQAIKAAYNRRLKQDPNFDPRKPEGEADIRSLGLLQKK